MTCVAPRSILAPFGPRAKSDGWVIDILGHSMLYYV